MSIYLYIYKCVHDYICQKLVLAFILNHQIVYLLAETHLCYNTEHFQNHTENIKFI